MDAVLTFVTQNASDLTAIVFGVVVLADKIAALTATKADDEAVGKVKAIVNKVANLFGLNVTDTLKR